jgi:hypothetical protein
MHLFFAFVMILGTFHEHFFFIAGVLLVPPREFETNLAVSLPPNIGIDNRPKTYQSL